ncbi:MAG: LLM class F420-dependent oxidoreductase, partial [Novosphingobium sp.]
PEFWTLDAVRAVATAAEHAGFSTALVTDHPCPPGRWLDSGGHLAQDPWVMMALVAGATTTLRVQTGILVLPYRNPFVVARSIATLDRFSGGRVTVGVGAGYLKGEYHALGVDFEQRNELMDEYLRALKVSLSQDEFSFKGTGYEARGCRIQPGPVQKPHPPLYIGGNAPRAIRRAVELGDAWYPFFTVAGVSNAVTRTAEISGIDDLEKPIAYMHAHCEKVGRENPPLIAVGSLISPGESWTPQKLIDNAGRMAALGVVAAGMHLEGGTVAEFCDNVARFGDEVIAKVRGSA